jgi:uncharacterized protein (TIGR02145 family)
MKTFPLTGFTLALLAFGSGSSIFATPTVSLFGKATDLSGNPLIGAVVVLNSSRMSAVTDSNGHWAMSYDPDAITTRSLPNRAATRHLVAQGGRLIVRFNNSDFAGRKDAQENEQKPALKTTSAERVSATPTFDSLIYTWQLKPLKRARVASSLQGDCGVQSMDTTWIVDSVIWNPEIEYGSLVDERDGQVYRTIKIGTQNWMAQNLNYNVANSWWDHNSANSGPTEGRHYTWSAALGLPNTYDTLKDQFTRQQGICPNGWHIPKDTEWATLNNVASKNPLSLCSRVGWNNWNFWEIHNNCTDATGFGIYPATFLVDETAEAIFWTSTEYTLNPFIDDPTPYDGMSVTIREFSFENAMLQLDMAKKWGASVRCLED